MSLHAIFWTIGGTAVVTALATVLMMHQAYRHRKDDKTEKKLENHEVKLEKLRETIHAHELKMQGLEHAIQIIGEARADQSYGRNPNEPDS